MVVEYWHHSLKNCYTTKVIRIHQWVYLATNSCCILELGFYKSHRKHSTLCWEKAIFKLRCWFDWGLNSSLPAKMSRVNSPISWYVKRTTKLKVICSKKGESTIHTPHECERELPDKQPAKTQNVYWSVRDVSSGDEVLVNLLFANGMHCQSLIYFRNI